MPALRRRRLARARPCAAGAGPEREAELSASFGSSGALLGMGTTTTRQQRGLKVLQSVSCLGCGGVYAKPAGGGTAAMNPGCPECGYLGWLPFTPEAGSRQPHYAADRRPHLHA